MNAFRFGEHFFIKYLQYSRKVVILPSRKKEQCSLIKDR